MAFFDQTKLDFRIYSRYRCLCSLFQVVPLCIRAVILALYVQIKDTHIFFVHLCLSLNSVNVCGYSPVIAHATPRRQHDDDGYDVTGQRFAAGTTLVYNADYGYCFPDGSNTTTVTCGSDGVWMGVDHISGRWKSYTDCCRSIVLLDLQFSSTSLPTSLFVIKLATMFKFIVGRCFSSFCCHVYGWFSVGRAMLLVFRCI